MSNQAWNSKEEAEVKRLLKLGYTPTEVAAECANKFDRSTTSVRLKATEVRRKFKIRAEKSNINDVKLPDLIQQIKDIPLKKIPVNSQKVGEKDAVLVISDAHYGALINNHEGHIAYFPELARKRLLKLASKFIEFSKTHQCQSVHVLLVGDNVDGAGIYPTHAAHVAMEPIDQVFGIASIYKEISQNLKEHFQKQTWWCVPGNHGRVDRFKAEVNNWDIFSYKVFELLVDCDVHIARSSVQIAEIRGHRGFIRHHVVKHAGTPARRDKLGSWYKQYNVDFFVGGHFHVPSVHDYEGVPVFLNGTLGEPNDLCDKIAKYSMPGQLAFTVSDKQVGVDIQRIGVRDE